jgi:hypothetical protein
MLNHHFISTKMATITKEIKKKTSVGEDIEKLEFLCLLFLKKKTEGVRAQFK